MNFIGIFAPVLTLIGYAIIATVNGSGYLDTKTVFTSIAIVSLVTGPANMVLTLVSLRGAALGSLERIQTYLLEPSRQDKRLGTRESLPKDHESVDEQSHSPSDRVVAPAISMKSVTTRHALSTETVLRKITLEVQTGWIVMISGAVGTGKTSLARAILGELSPESGTISVSSKRIAFCAQTPWLPNDTIKNIICGPKGNLDIDEQWYEQVISACALEEDLGLLPYGDQSLIGSRGLTLSGGQRQRVVSEP